MALDPKSKKDIDEARLFIQDTLLSVGAKISESIKDSIEQAVDGVDASVMEKLGKDITRSFSSIAKFSDDTANNTYRIDQGLLKSKDVTKQLLSLQEKMAQLDRKKELANLNQIKFNEEDFQAAKKSLESQQQLLQNDLEETKRIEKKLGLVGKFTSSLGQIPGIGQFLRVDEIEVEMRKAAADGAGRFKTMGIAASMVGKQLAEGLTDPAFILGKMFDTYLKINKASVDAIHLTGQNAVNAASLGANYASAVDYLETLNELTKKTGMNAQNIFSEKVIGQAAALKTTMGLTADEAGGLAIMSQTTGKEVNNIVDSVVATTSAFNGANRAAVSQGAVLREVANTTDSIKLSLGNNDVALTKAAAAATRLGLSLQDVDDIAASLTEFESSISNELEAELLIGKDLNLEKARELALNNDLEGVSKELFKNSADINEFGKLNRIQQEAYAKSLGMTKDQLAKIAYNKSLELGMTEEQAEAAAGVEASEMKRIAAQENFAKAMEKIAGAVAPILDLVGDILSMPLAPYILLGVVATGKLVGSITGVAKGFGAMYKAGKDAVLGVVDLFKKGGLTSAIDKIKGAFGEGTGDMVKSKSGKLFSKDSPQGKMIANLSGNTDKAGDVATDAKDKIAGGSKGGFKSAMKDVAGGLKAMGAEGVGKGIFNLLVAGPALVVAVASIPFLLAVAAIGKAAGVGLEGLASGLKALGKAGVEGLIGVGLIAALGVAMIPFGYALGLAAPAIEAFGTVVTAVFDGVAKVLPVIVDGFVTLISTLAQSIGPMLLLGPALFGIAAGLAAIAIAGPMAIPSLLAVTGLAAVAGGVATIFGAGDSKSAGEAKGKGEEGSLAAVEKKLDALIAAVKAGGDVYMDSNKVGKAQVLGTYKSA